MLFLLTTAKPVITHTETENKTTNNHRTQFLPSITDNNKENKELSSVLRRRRDRFARQAHRFIQQQEMLNHSNSSYNDLFPNANGSYTTTNSCFTSTNFNSSTPKVTKSNGRFSSLNGSFTNIHEKITSSNGTLLSPIAKFTNTNGHFTNTNGNYTKDTYTNNTSYSSVSGDNNVSTLLNGVNGHQEEDDNYLCRTMKNFNLADVLKNGLWFH